VTWVNLTVVAEMKMVAKFGSTIVLARQLVHLKAVVLSACAGPLAGNMQQPSTAAVAVTVAVGVVLAAGASESNSAAAAGLAVAVGLQNFAAVVGPAVVVIHDVVAVGVGVEPMRYLQSDLLSNQPVY
jgi:orotate phosphoribosyltransferase-like protein